MKLKRSEKLTKRCSVSSGQCCCSQVCSCIVHFGFKLNNHPLYSLNLPISDYFLFPNMKKHLAENWYQTSYDVLSAVVKFFGGQEDNFYTTGIQALQRRWKKCTDRRGDYVEKYNAFGQIQVLHVSQTINISAYPRIFTKGQPLPSSQDLTLYLCFLVGPLPGAPFSFLKAILRSFLIYASPGWFPER